MPSPLDFDKARVLAAYELEKLECDKLKNAPKGATIASTTVVDPTSASASTFPRPTRKLSLLNLREGARVRNGFISGTIISPHPLQKTGVLIVLETRKEGGGSGGCVLVWLYNFAPPRAEQNWLEAMLPRGAEMRVYEPYMKRYPGNVTVRVDNPMDVEISLPPLPEGDVTSSAVREEGNALLKRSKFRPAWLKYSIAMSLSRAGEGSDFGIALANRAQVCLEEHRFGAALKDSTDALAVLDCNSLVYAKTQLRKANALMGLERFDEAIALLKVMSAFKSGAGEEAMKAVLEQADKLLKRAEISLDQAQHGNFDWDELIFGKGTLQKHVLPNFVGPIQISSNAGGPGLRGLVATRDLLAGELLLVEKSLVSGSSSGKDVGTVDIFTKTLLTEADLELQTKLVSLCMDREDVLRKMNTLFDGSDENSGDRDLLAFDVNRLRRVIKLNSFGSSSVDPTAAATEADKLIAQARSKKNQLFYWVSLMNHSCVSNTFTLAWDNAYIIRASRNIACGEQITTRYRPFLSVDTVSERRAVLLRSWGFSCKCELCSLQDKYGSVLEELKRGTENNVTKGMALKLQYRHREALVHFNQAAIKIDRAIDDLQCKDKLSLQDVRLLKSAFMRVFDHARFCAHVPPVRDEEAFFKMQDVMDDLMEARFPLSYEHLVSVGYGVLQKQTAVSKYAQEFERLHQLRYGLRVQIKRGMKETTAMMINASLPRSDWYYRFVKCA